MKIRALFASASLVALTGYGVANAACPPPTAGTPLNINCYAQVLPTGSTASSSSSSASTTVVTFNSSNGSDGIGQTTTVTTTPVA